MCLRSFCCIGTISIVDLRLLGIASLDRALDRLMRDVLPYTWSAFAVAVVTGGLLFSSNAVIYAHNFFFQGKPFCWLWPVSIWRSFIC